MTDFIAQLDELLPTRTAGSLPSTRTNGMYESAMASDDIAEVRAELQHTRAHYQALEYVLNSEDHIVKTLLSSWDAGYAPKPETAEEGIRLAVRAIATQLLLVAYDTAHEVGLPIMLFGMSVQDALQNIIPGLDYSDPDAAVPAPDDELKKFLDDIEALANSNPEPTASLNLDLGPYVAPNSAPKPYTTDSNGVTDKPAE